MPDLTYYPDESMLDRRRRLDRERRAEARAATPAKVKAAKRRESDARYRKAIGKVPSPEKRKPLTTLEIVWLIQARQADYKITTIARALNVTVGTVSRHLSKARDRGVQGL